MDAVDFESLEKVEIEEARSPVSSIRSASAERPKPGWSGAITSKSRERVKPGLAAVHGALHQALRSVQEQQRLAAAGSTHVEFAAPHIERDFVHSGTRLFPRRKLIGDSTRVKLAGVCICCLLTN